TLVSQETSGQSAWRYLISAWGRGVPNRRPKAASSAAPTSWSRNTSTGCSAKTPWIHAKRPSARGLERSTPRTSVPSAAPSGWSWGACVVMTNPPWLPRIICLASSLWTAAHRGDLVPHGHRSRRDLHAHEAKMGQGPVSCRFCKRENPAGARFCNDCGAPLATPTITPEPRSYTPRHLVEKILASQSALRGERKLVTVLFADVVRMHYTRQGHFFGLAARVQKLAPPGGITVTEQTARLAAGFYDFLDRGEQSLKGASVPVRVFELRGPGQIRSRPESSRARGFSRFVGRERELALLERALRETQSGRPKVVLVTAEPGAGKSRLCHEFVERARGVALHYARALSHGRMLPFHVMVALARSLFGVGEGASPSDVRDAVRCGLGNAQPDPIALDFWLDLLGVSDHVPAPSG